MRSYSGVIKIVLTIAFCVVALFVFTGCGTLETEMNLNTGFVGERTMNVSVPQEDMSEKITGGEEAFDAVVNTNLPAELTVQKNYDSENSVFIYSFVLEFSNLEDYTAKVNALLVKAGYKDLNLRIIFEEFDSEFKSGLAFSENFSSEQLMIWLANALEKADIVEGSKDKQTWFEQKMPTFMYNGEEHALQKNLYYNINTDGMTYNTFEDIALETKLESDGTFVRTINFVMAEEVVQRLEVTKDIAVSAYFSTLVDELGDGVATFEETVDSEEATVTYTITFTASNLKALAHYTNTIMKSENSGLSVSVIADEATGGVVVTTSEVLDASHYLNYNEKLPTSSLEMYQGCVFRKQDGSNAREFIYPVRKTTYWLQPGEVVTVEFDWEVMFPEVELILTMGNKIKAELSLRISEKANKVFLDSIKKHMLGLEPVEGKMTKKVSDGNLVYTIEFGSGTDEEIQTKVNAFLLEYADYVGKSWLVPSENSLRLSYYEETSGSGFFSKDYSLYFSFKQNIFSENSNTVVVRTGFGASFIGEEIEKEKELVFTDNWLMAVSVNIRQLNIASVIVLLLAVVALAVVLIIVAGRMGKKRKMKALAAGMQQPPMATMQQQGMYQPMPTGMQQQAMPPQAPFMQGGGAPPNTVPLNFYVPPTAGQASAGQGQAASPQPPQVPQGQEPQATKMFIVPADDMYEKTEKSPQTSTEISEPATGE